MCNNPIRVNSLGLSALLDNLVTDYPNLNILSGFLAEYPATRVNLS